MAPGHGQGQGSWEHPVRFPAADGDLIDSDTLGSGNFIPS